MRRLLAAVVAVVLASPVLAQNRDQLTIDLPADVATMDPQIQWDTDSATVYRNLFDNLLTRDKTGQIVARMGEWGERGQTHWASLVTAAIVNGATTACYDGQYFYSTSHSEGASGVQSNKIDCDISVYPCTLHGTTAAPSVEEMQHAIIDGIVKIVSYLDDKGEPMNENANAFVVMVPLSLMKVARGAVSGLTPQMLPQNLNPDKFADFKVRVVVNVRLTTAGWTDKFAVNREDSPIKPFIRQTEQEVELKVKAEGSEFEFDNDAWQFGLDGWRGVGYGYWQRSVLCTLI